MEAKYLATSHATTQALWLRTFLSELGFPPQQPITLHMDNIATLDFSNDHMISQQSKHIDICHHFVRDAITQKHVTTVYVPSRDNLADLFTKALPTPTQSHFVHRLGLMPELRGSVGN